MEMDDLLADISSETLNAECDITCNRKVLSDPGQASSLALYYNLFITLF